MRHQRRTRRRHRPGEGWIRFRLHRDRLRVWRQRGRPPAGGEGLSCRRHGDGAALDARQFAAHQLVHPSLVLASQTRIARLLQHAVLPACDHLPWLRRGWRIDYLCQHPASSRRESLGIGLLDWIVRLENRNAPALRDRRAHVRCYGKQNPWTCRPSPAQSGGSLWSRAYVLLHEGRYLPAG